MRVRYEYIEAYVLTGFGRPQAEDDTILYRSSEGTALAVIPSDLDTYVSDVDKDAAVRSFVFMGFFHAARADERPRKMEETVQSRREVAPSSLAIVR